MIIEVGIGQLDFKGPQSPTSLHPRPYKAGSLALTGLALTLAFAIAIPAGAVTVTGYTPGFGELKVPVGALTITGYAPTISTGLRIDLPAGSLVFKGPQAPITSHTIAIPAGSQLYRSDTPAVSIDTLIAIPAGSLVYGGLVFTVETTSGGVGALPPVASVIIRGLAPTLNIGPLIAIPAGSLVFKGPQRPAIVVQLPPPGNPAGALVWHGLAPDVSINVPGSLITFPAASLVWHGYAPVVTPDHTIAIPVGTLTFSGKYVGVAFLQPAAGSLVWHGLVPTTIISGSPTIVLPVGMLTFTGQAPVTARDYTTDLAVGVATFVGYAPTVAIARAFKPWLAQVNRVLGGGFAG